MQEEAVTPRIVTMEAHASVSPEMIDAIRQGQQPDISDLLSIWAAVELSFARMPAEIRQDARESCAVKYLETADDFDLWDAAQVTDREADVLEAARATAHQDATEEAALDGYETLDQYWCAGCPSKCADCVVERGED